MEDFIEKIEKTTVQIEAEEEEEELKDQNTVLT